MSIDWNKPETLRRRDNPEVRAVQVHVIPEWCCVICCVCVQWNDDDRHFYTIDGKHSSYSKLDAIPAPRSGEGWIDPDRRVPIVYPHKHAEHFIEIRWEQVIE